jgi:hypothetical protein
MSTASSARVSFALSARERQLDLTIGPLRAGAGAALAPRLAAVADEFATERLDGSELLRVVVRGGDRSARAVS